MTSAASAPAGPPSSVPVVLVRLKVRLLRNRWRLARGRVAAVVSAIIAVIAGVVGLVLAMSAGSAIDGRDRAGFAVIGSAAVVLVWAAVPLLSMNVDDTLDPARLQLLPLRAGPLMIGLLAGSLIGFGPVALTLTLVGVVVGYAAGVATFVTLIAAVGVLVLGAATARTVATLLAASLTSRRGRDVTIAIAAVLGIGLQLLRFVHFAHIDPDDIDRVTNVVRWTPPGALGHAVVDVQDGRLAVAVAEVAYGLAVIPLLLLIWRRALERSLTTVTSPTTRASHAVDVGADRLRLMPRSMPWLPGTPVGAVIAKELRSTTRDPRRRIGLLQLVVIGLGFPIWFAIARSSGSPGVVFVASVAGYLAILGAMNQFATDGGALWIDVVAGDRIRVELVGKNLAVVTQAVPVLVLGTLSVATITGQWRYAPVAILVGVGGLGAGLAVANVVSVRFPQKPPDSRNPFAGAGGGAGLTQTFALLGAILVQGVVISPIAIATAIAIAVAPAALVVVAPACAVYGYVLWRVGVTTAYHWAAPRQPELLAVVDSRRETPSSTAGVRTTRWAASAGGQVATAVGNGAPVPAWPAPVAVPVTGARALRAGLGVLKRRWRPTASVAVFMGVAIVGSFVVMVAGNSLAFGYDYFVDDPPPGAASLVAGISLAAFWVLCNGVFAWAFGALCVLGLEPGATARQAIRRAWQTVVHRSWRAIPAMMITSAGLLIVVGGPLLIAAFLPYAVRDVMTSGSRPSRRTSARFSMHLVISLPITGLALASWLVGSRFNGVDVPDAAVAALLVALAALVATAAAWTAFAAAELHLASG